MSGVLRAPQLGFPRVKDRHREVVEVRRNKRAITPGEIEELARLLQEAEA